MHLHGLGINFLATNRSAPTLRLVNCRRIELRHVGQALLLSSDDKDREQTIQDGDAV